MTGKDVMERDYEWMISGLRNIIRRYDESPRRYTLESLLEDVRWMVKNAKKPSPTY